MLKTEGSMLRILLFALLLASASTFAQIKIENAKTRAFNLALPEFIFKSADASVSRHARTIRDVMVKNLELSGDFKVITKKAYLKPETGISKKETNFNQYKMIGAEGIAKTKILIKGKKIKVEMQLLTLHDRSQGRRYRYEVREAQLPFLARKLADDVYRFYSKTASPFLSLIVAMQRINGADQLVALSFDGALKTVLTYDKAIKIMPSFSSRNKILFTRYDRKNPNLYEMDLTKRRLRSISVENGLKIGAKISPDKAHYIVTMAKNRNRDIYKMKLNGQVIRRLTRSWGIDISASYNSKGDKIAFVSTRLGYPQIFVMGANGQDQRPIVHQGKFNQSPKFHPKANMIVFAGRDERGLYDLFLQDLSKPTATRITDNIGRNEDPDFVPNGKLIIFTSTRYKNKKFPNGSRDIFVTNLSGSHQRRITSDGNYWTPVCGPDLSFDLALFKKPKDKHASKSSRG